MTPFLCCEGSRPRQLAYEGLYLALCALKTSYQVWICRQVTWCKHWKSTIYSKVGPVRSQASFKGEFSQARPWRLSLSKTLTIRKMDKHLSTVSTVVPEVTSQQQEFRNGVSLNSVSPIQSGSGRVESSPAQSTGLDDRNGQVAGCGETQRNRETQQEPMLVAKLIAKKPYIAFGK